MRERSEVTTRMFAGYPVRHWVGALPNPLRYNIGNDPDLLGACIKAFVNAIFRWQRWHAKATFGLKSVNFAHPAAASFLHRISADMSTNVHFHVIGLDGVFTQDEDSGSFTFRRFAPTHEDLAQVAHYMFRKTCAVLEQKRIWHPDPDTDVDHADGLLTMPGFEPERVTFTSEAAQTDAEKPRAGLAFNVWAGHPVDAGDAVELEKLAQYVSAPPITDWQFTIIDGNIVSTLRRPRFDGTTWIEHDPFGFLDRIAAMVHRPRAHVTRQHGAMAPNARFRKMLFVDRLVSPDRGTGPVGPDDAAYNRAKQFVHARAVRREVDTCPACSSKLRVVSVTYATYTYRNPRWIKPDTPSLIHPADAKTGSSPIPAVV